MPGPACSLKPTLGQKLNPAIFYNESITNGARLGLFLKDEGNRVDAPALICGDVKALALKDVTQVRITFGTADLGSDAWGQRAIFN